MEIFDYTITAPEGLHARPAGLLVKCAQGCTSSVQIRLNGKEADAKRLFSVMGLCVKQNDNVTFEVSGENEKTDCETLKAFCQKDL